MSSKYTTIDSLFPFTPASSHSYTVTLSDSFCIGTVPNGGYVTSAFLHCARTHIQKTHPTLRTTDPMNLHLEFLRRTSAGPATFVVRDVKLGSRISNLHLTLRQHRDANDPNTPIQDEVEGYITLTSLAGESGVTHETNYKPLPTPLPVDLIALPFNNDKNYTRRRADPYGAFRRGSLHAEMYLVRPSRRSTPYNPSIVDQWVRFRPLVENQDIVAGLKAGTSPDGSPTGLQTTEGRWTNDSLGYVVDMFPQLNESYTNPAIEDSLLSSPAEISDQEIQDLVRGKSKSKSTSENSPSTAPRTYWYPTLLLNLDVKKQLPAAGVEWLFVRVRAKKIQNGRFDLEVEVWDEDGDVVALSTHANLVLGAERNIARGGAGEKDGKGKEKAKESKSKI